MTLSLFTFRGPHEIMTVEYLASSIIVAMMDCTLYLMFVLMINIQVLPNCKSLH